MINSVDGFLLGFVLGPVFMIFLEILSDLFKNISFYKKSEDCKDRVPSLEDDKIQLANLEKKLKKCIDNEKYLFVSASQRYITMDQINQKSEERKRIENEFNIFFKKLIGMNVYDAYKIVEEYNYLIYVKFEKIETSHICDNQCNNNILTNQDKKIVISSDSFIRKINVKAQGSCKYSSVITELVEVYVK